MLGGRTLDDSLAVVGEQQAMLGICYARLILGK